jgi:hypothetical protein
MTTTLVQTCNATWCSYRTNSSSTVFETWNKGNPGIDRAIVNNPFSWGSRYPVFTVGLDGTGRSYGPKMILSEIDFIGVSGRKYFERHDADGFFPYPHKEDITATTCSLWACVQAHDIEIKDGKQTSRPVKTWAEGTWGLEYATIRNFNFTDIPVDFNVESGTVYGFDSTVSLPTTGLLSGTVTDDRRGNFRFDTVEIQAIWTAAHDLPAFYGNLSLSLSNWMRQAGTVTVNERYAGQALAPEVYFEAHFLWLIFPASLVTLSVLLLVVSIVQTYRHKVPAWKDNALSAIFVNVEPCHSEDIGTDLEIEKVAKQIRERKVKLSDDSYGWVLR